MYVLQVSKLNGYGTRISPIISGIHGSGCAREKDQRDEQRARVLREMPRTWLSIETQVVLAGRSSSQVLVHRRSGHRSILSRPEVSKRFNSPKWGDLDDVDAVPHDSQAIGDVASNDLYASGNVKPVKESPGERFLNRALQGRRVKIPKDQREGPSSTVPSVDDVKVAPKIKKKKDAPLVNLLNHNQPSCYGCGALLQTSEAEAPGYIPPQTFELKKKHHQLKTLLCGRCRLLSQGQMIPAVGGLGGYGSGKGYIPAEQLRAQLSHLRYQKALVIKLVDIVDFNGSFLGRIRDLVGANPIILVLTKVDLLPEGTDFTALSDWIQEAIVRKKMNVISIHLTSSKARTGISRVAADITRQRLGRDVYILGSANVGKSAFVTALLQDMGRRDLVAAAALRFKPIQSAMPGTTLGPIEFEAFNGGGKLFDTPGVHLHHRIAAALDPQDVGLLAPRRRLRGYVVGPPQPGEEEIIGDETKELEPEEEEPEESIFEDIDLDTFLNKRSGGRNWWQDTSLADEENTEQTESWTGGYSLFWGGLARIDVVKAPEDLKFTFYGPSAIRVTRVPIEEANIFYQALTIRTVQENIATRLSPPSANTVGKWAGLEKVQEISLVAEQLSNYPVGDLAISGLGWITIGKATVIEDCEEDMPVIEGGAELRTPKPSRKKKSDDPKDLYSDDDEIRIILHTPKAVEIFIRPSMPLGKTGAKWYEYADLSDAELEARPKVFF